MLPISLPYVIQLSDQLERLTELPEEDVDRWPAVLPLFIASGALRQLLSESIYSRYLRSSRGLGEELLAMLDRHTVGEDKDREQIQSHDLWLIKSKYGEYRIVLLSELGSLATFFVTQKGGFDTAALLWEGETLFSEELGTKVPEAVFDAKEAAKCLAFEVSTAAGYHLFRVTECVLRRYYSHVTGGSPHPKHRNIGVYLRAMRSVGAGDPRIIESLQQLSDLHRNPLIHPEIALTPDEALALAGMARSVTTAMMAKMPIPPQTTSGARSGA